MTSCDNNLTKTQVRNPKLKRRKDGNAFTESAADPMVQTIVVSLFCGLIVMCAAGLVTLGVLAAIPHVDPTQSNTLAVGLVFGASMFCYVFYAFWLAPTIFPPLEFSAAAQKDAYLKFESLPPEQQSDVRNAYTVFMSCDGGSKVPYNSPESRAYTAAHKMWDDTVKALDERDKLLNVKEVVIDPRIEEARRDLEDIVSTNRMLSEKAQEERMRNA